MLPSGALAQALSQVPLLFRLTWGAVCALRQCFGAVLQASSRLLQDISTRTADPALLWDLPFSGCNLEKSSHDSSFLP